MKKYWVWRKEAPTETGWYWFRSLERRGCVGAEPKCVLVEMHPELGPRMLDGRSPQSPSSWPGEWCGPIPEPGSLTKTKRKPN